MNTIPSPEQIRAALEALSWASVRDLARKTGTPFTTIWKLRNGETANPQLRTVERIWPELRDGA